MAMSKGQEIANKLAGAQTPANKSLSLGAAIASAVGAIGAAGISGYSQYRANQRSIDLMHEQNNWNLDQWNRENAYNLPSSQIARLKAAGLNPALIYGEQGLMNEAASSQPAADAPNMRPNLQIDPLTASQVALNTAQAKSIEHQTEREDDKQGLTLQHMEEQLNSLREFIKGQQKDNEGKDLDNQIKSVEYLSKSLDYSFHNATFSNAVLQTTADLKKAIADQHWSEFQVERGLKILTYELIGFDLDNQATRLGLEVSREDLRQSRILFNSVKEKYHWDAQNSRERFNNTRQDTLLKREETSLKHLSYWIDARDNPRAFNLLRAESNKNWDYINEFFDGAIRNAADDWNHGFNLPIKIGFGSR